jgi:hypothetical protein
MLPLMAKLRTSGWFKGWATDWTKDGKPVTVAAAIEVNFRLGNPPAAANSAGANQMLACSFAKTNCLRIPIAQPQAGQMIQLSATQFAIFDGQGWHIADMH